MTNTHPNKTPAPADWRFQFDRSDRIRRAMRVSGLGVSELADSIEVSRNTISNWINGRANPRARDLRQIARLTGFPYEWLLTGQLPEGTQKDLAAVAARSDVLPDLDSNQEPAGTWPQASDQAFLLRRARARSNPRPDPRRTDRRHDDPRTRRRQIRRSGIRACTLTYLALELGTLAA